MLCQLSYRGSASTDRRIVAATGREEGRLNGSYSVRGEGRQVLAHRHVGSTVTQPPSSRSSYAVVALLAIAAVLAGCGGGDKESNELIGLVVDVQGRGNDVSSFTLESGGEEYRIRIAPEVDYGFQLSHLSTHQASLYPVRCTFERRAGRLYALEILDA
jgi:hypothetical protein